jgi:hypothetical protein
MYSASIAPAMVYLFCYRVIQSWRLIACEDEELDDVGDVDAAASELRFSFDL